MNKFTKRIIKFLDDNYKLELYNFDHKIIHHMRNIFRTLVYEEIKMIEEHPIKKLHNYDQDGLLYMLFNDHFQNVESFADWYRMNMGNINLRSRIKQSKISDILFKPNKSRAKLHRLLYHNNFVSYDVIHHAECEDLIYRVYEGNNSEIHIYAIKKFPDISLISKIISFMRKLFNQDIRVNLVIFCGKQKKYLSDHKYICSDNVNSGSTIAGVEIMLWREEELYKVLIHELIHYFDIDFYVSDNIYNKINQLFETKFDVDDLDRVNESYTESLAIIINSLIYSELNKLEFNKILSYEMLFTQFQVSKIIEHNLRFGSQFYQKTSACSYYIVKYMLLLNYQKLFDFYEKYGFRIQDNETQYIKLYKDTLNIKVNKLKIPTSIEDQYVRDTMRMSLFSL